MTLAVATWQTPGAATAPLALREWGCSSFSAPLSDADLELLDRLAAKKVLTYRLTRRGFEVQAASFVGRVHLSAGTLRIEPKVTVGHLLRLLAYAMRLDDLLLLHEVATPAGIDFPELLFAALLRGVAEVLRHGLIKAYQQLVEEPPSLRGRWLISRDPLRPLLRPQTFLVEREELTLDVTENRVLLAALDVVSRLTRSSSQRTEARRHRNLLAQVAGLPALPLVELKQIRLHRLNQHYQPALQAARIVLQGSALADEQEPRDVSLPAFFIDMNKVFEAFVGRLLAESLGPSWRVLEQESVSGHLVHQPKGGQAIRPDLLLIEQGTGRRIIGDAKYKLDLPPSPADLYQLTFYLHALQDEPAPPGLIFCPSAFPLIAGPGRDEEGSVRIMLRTSILPARPELLRSELFVVALDLDALAERVGEDGRRREARECLAGILGRIPGFRAQPRAESEPGQQPNVALAR